MSGCAFGRVVRKEWEAGVASRPAVVIDLEARAQDPGRDGIHLFTCRGQNTPSGASAVVGLEHGRCMPSLAGLLLCASRITTLSTQALNTWDSRSQVTDKLLKT